MSASSLHLVALTLQRSNLVNQAVMLWYNFGGATPPQVFRFYYAKDVRSAPRVVQWVARLAGFADGGKR